MTGYWLHLLNGPGWYYGVLLVWWILGAVLYEPLLSTKRWWPGQCYNSQIMGDGDLHEIPNTNCFRYHPDWKCYLWWSSWVLFLIIAPAFSAGWFNAG